MKLEVEKEMVEPIIRDHIAAAIVEQMGNPEELIRRMVGLAIHQKVNSEGKLSKYSSDNKYDLLEALAGIAIREAAKEAIARMIEEHKPALEEALVAELRRSPRKTAAGIVAGLVGLIDNRYKLNVGFEFKASD